MDIMRLLIDDISASIFNNFSSTPIVLRLRVEFIFFCDSFMVFVNNNFELKLLI